MLLQMHLCHCTDCVKLTVVSIMMKHQGFAAEPWQLYLATQHLHICRDRRLTLDNVHQELHLASIKKFNGEPVSGVPHHLEIMKRTSEDPKAAVAVDLCNCRPATENAAGQYNEGCWKLQADHAN